MDSKLTAITAIEKKITELHQCKEVIALLPNAGEIRATTGSVHVIIPYDLKSFRKYRKLLGTEWECKNQWSIQHEKSNARTYDYCHKNTKSEFMLSMDTSKNGSSCQRVLVGQESVDVYEVKCE